MTEVAKRELDALRGTGLPALCVARTKAQLGLAKKETSGTSAARRDRGKEGLGSQEGSAP